MLLGALGIWLSICDTWYKWAPKVCLGVTGLFFSNFDEGQITKMYLALIYISN